MAVRAERGTTLAGRYRLIEQLGEGAMGSVWRAEHLILSLEVAIKILDPEVARGELQLARFLLEARTLAALESPHVVAVLDFGAEAGTAYLVMELLRGQTLGARLAKQGRLSLSETQAIFKEVCSAMRQVHEQGLIHRDLKPENIFLCERAGKTVTKVVDFGIAKSMRVDPAFALRTRTGHVLGTPSYMSPEQCRGVKDIDHRADLWALGVIAYECLVGDPPFEGEALGDLMLHICMDPLPIPSERAPVPPGFDAWFERAVARDRESRFQSASELAAAFVSLSVFSDRIAVRTADTMSQPSQIIPSDSEQAFGVRSTTETNTTVGFKTVSEPTRHPAFTIALGALLLGSTALTLWLALTSRSPQNIAAEAQSLRPVRGSTPRGSSFSEPATGVAPTPVKSAPTAAIDIGEGSASATLGAANGGASTAAAGVSAHDSVRGMPSALDAPSTIQPPTSSSSEPHKGTGTSTVQRSQTVPAKTSRKSEDTRSGTGEKSIDTDIRRSR